MNILANEQIINSAKRLLKTFGLILWFVIFGLACTNRSDQVTLEDYQRAEQFLSPNTLPLAYGLVTSQNWSGSNRLIYKVSVAEGHRFMMVNLSDKTKELAFDHQQLANELSAMHSESYDEYNLPISGLEINEEGTHLSFQVEGQFYRMELEGTRLVEKEAIVRNNEILSPNREHAAYIKGHNLWIRNTSTNERTQLTFDGIKDYGYATNNAGWIRRDSPVLLWSPDSRKIATFRHDGRGVGEMYLWSTRVGHPELDAWKYPLPGDSLIFRIERIVIDLDKPGDKIIKLKMDADPHRSTTSDHIAGRGGRFLDVQWSADGSQLAFISSSRDHKIAHLRIANTTTGSVRSVLREEVDTYFESGSRDENWFLLENSNEVIWFSEKSNWGHLYLHDLETGQLKNPITSGDWVVLQLLHVDEVSREVYFLGSNREEGDPYYQYLYRVKMDGSDLTNLTPEYANHQINWNPLKTYFTDSYSTPTDPPTTIIRDKEGNLIMYIEEGDISDLLAAGWVPPLPFTVKARDSITDLYGLMYRPSNFDPSRKYPILNYLYPGPQSGSVGSRSFSPSRRDKQAVAELGFIVVEVDAMGTPGRSKSFHDIYYGNMGDNGLPDQIGTIKQLAAENSWMDIDRVGIWGHSGGGFASTDAILRYPDFYKVAVSGAGNHDNRNYEDDWGEKWQGLLERIPADPNRVDLEIQDQIDQTNYDNQANQLLAENLKGKLLIAHGMLDDNVHPSNTLLVVDALIKAEKDFDMLVFPNARHGFGNSRYFMKRRWDYFVQHLKNQQPPEGFYFGDNIR
jgi:dienelactone hydrolase